MTPIGLTADTVREFLKRHSPDYGYRDGEFIFFAPNGGASLVRTETVSSPIRMLVSNSTLEIFWRPMSLSYRERAVRAKLEVLLAKGSIVAIDVDPRSRKCELLRTDRAACSPDFRFRSSTSGRSDRPNPGFAPNFGRWSVRLAPHPGASSF